MRGQNAPSSNIFILCTLLYSMVYFRVECVVNHDTFMYGVVCPKTGTTLKDGVAIYHPIGQYEFHKRVFQSGPPLLRTMDVVSYLSKGVLKFRTPLLRKDAAPSIPTGMSRNTTYPHGTNRSSPHYCTKQRDAPKQGIPFLKFTSLLTFIRILLFPFFQLLLPLFTRI